VPAEEVDLWRDVRRGAVPLASMALSDYQRLALDVDDVVLGDLLGLT